jgi:CheY-like chemotaxis protein
MIVITLPRHEPETRAHTQPRVDLKGDAGAKTILYIDDEPIVRSVTENALRGLGYTVLAADSGQSALNTYLAHRTSISLIITDVVMPGMSGPELIERLRAFGPLPPVLFTTGYADASALAGISLDGAVISKPYSMAELAARIRRALDESAAASPDKQV